MTDARPVDITFFVPCYNEEQNIIPTLETLVAAAGRFSFTYEILVVDDCSTDESVEKIQRFQSGHPGLNLVLRRNPRNVGLGRNFVDAAFFAKGEFFMLVNGDHAEPEDALAALLSHLGEADMIIPYFSLQSDKRTFVRRRLSRAFTALINLISGHRIRYYNGPAIHRRFNVMRWHSDTDGFSYQAEIITRVLDNGSSFKQVQISNIDRQEGSTKAFRLKNMLSVSHSLLQIFLRRIRRIFFREYYGCPRPPANPASTR